MQSFKDTDFDGDDLETAFPDRGDRNKIVAPKWIGNIRCYWHDKYGVPRITVGPNWGFTICLGFLVTGALYSSATALYGMF